MKRYMYIAVRKDLSPSQQAVQSCHAAIEASWIYHNELEKEEHPSVIILGVKNEYALNIFNKYVESMGFPYATFREPDRDNEMTSVAVFPVHEEDRKHFRKYRLLT